MIQKNLTEDVEIQLKLIIKNKLSIDIDKAKKKLRDNVLAKMIYSKILRDDGYTWKSIANSISRDHSTVMYQYRVLTDLMKFDKKIERKYLEVRNDFLSGEEFLEGQTIGGLKKIIINLQNDNKILILRIKELESKR